MSEHVPLLRDADAVARWLAGCDLALPVALDTEADGMFHYRTRLCYVQLAVGEHIAIVDTLAVDVRVLRDLLGGGGPEKILHDLAFDARLLADHEVALAPVFDTAIAARFLGIRATGLKAMLASELDIVLDKSLQQADWSVRPLPSEAIAYLADDVRHLASLSGVLRARLESLDIAAEVACECAYFTAQAQRPRAEPTAFARVPATAQLAPKVRARLHALVEVRERLAEARDIPAGRMLPTQLLVAMAEAGRASASQLARFAREDEAEQIQHALAAGDAAEDAPAHELARLFAPAPVAAELRAQKRRRAQLMAFRERAAAARGVDPQVVLPGHCINDLVGEPSLDLACLTRVPGLGARRLERYASALLTELASSWSQA